MTSWSAPRADAARDLFAGRIRLIRMFGAGGALLAVGLAAVHLVAALLPIAGAAATGHFAGTLTGSSDGSVLLATVLLISLAVALRGADELANVLGDVLSRRIDGSVRRHLRRLAHSPAGIGHLEDSGFHDDALRASDTGQGIGQLRSPGTAAVGQLVLLFRFLSALAGATLLATFSVWLAVALLAASLIVRLRLRRQWVGLVGVKDADADGQRRLGYLSDLAVLSGAKDLRIYGLADWLLRRQTALAHKVHGPTWREMWRVLRSQKLALGLGTASVAVALGFPAHLALTGQIGSAGLVTAVTAAWTVFAISSVGQEAFDIEYGLCAVRALDRLDERYGPIGSLGQRSLRDQESHRRVTHALLRPPTVRFEDVGFAYPNSPPVLTGLSLTLEPGRTIAVVGRNGAGKTTLIKLLAGLYSPTTGTITVNGRRLSELDQAWWRRQLTVVFQDYLKYPATLADNVAMSSPERLGDRDAVVRALHRAGASDLVAALPQGLNTSLWREGDKGAELSGGQWQRIAIARALFAVAHGSRLLVLDEPTAQLDVRGEAAFYERVVDQSPDTTVVLISHRLSTVRWADHIVLLQDGSVAEQGSHDQLMSYDGEYRRLFDLQAARFMDGSQQSPARDADR
ncbi:ABC transporter ATP-binding protein/permease [Kribbella sp. NBC_01505]|uniref:ABC transporter ATP-binding protein n=1 Tax=Kribbella sp. NBC_01505 TaxID=2903580 RepID=UPI00386C74B3